MLYSANLATAIWVKTAPLGNIPSSLSNIARRRTSVLTKPFIIISACFSRISATALREASSGESTIIVSKPSFCAKVFRVISEHINMGFIKPSWAANETASCVWLSSDHTTTARLQICFSLSRLISCLKSLILLSFSGMFC